MQVFKEFTLLYESSLHNITSATLFYEYKAILQAQMPPPPKKMQWERYIIVRELW